MAKRFSAERALELIFEEREDDEEVDEEVSEDEDHISENSDIDFEEEDEIEHQPKRRRATGPAHQQPAPAH